MNPTIDFSTFVLSISTSAMTYLGVVEHPESHEIEVNLVVAKQNIDILTLLKEKTCGNLTSEEQKLIDTLLYDLRMRYLEAKKEAR